LDSNVSDMTTIQNRFSQLTIRSPPPETSGQHFAGRRIPSIVITDEACSRSISMASSLSATSLAFWPSWHPYAQVLRVYQVSAPVSVASTSTLSPSPVLNDPGSVSSATRPTVIGDSKQRSASAQTITPGSQLQAPVHVPVKQAPVQPGLTQAAPIQPIFVQPGPIQETPAPVSVQSVPAQQVGAQAQPTEAVAQLNAITQQAVTRRAPALQSPTQQAPVQQVVASQAPIQQATAQKPPVPQAQPAQNSQASPAKPPVRGLPASRHAPRSNLSSSFMWPSGPTPTVIKK